MQLAERMSRIGVESAFDVLVRARALEAQGRSVIHLEIGEPDFPTPPHVAEAPVPMRLEESRGFSFDLNRFEPLLTRRTKMVVLNSPQNPTGGVIPRADLQAIADLLRERDVVVLSDEIYSEIYYGEPPVSIAAFPGMLEKTIILPSPRTTDR